MTASDDRAHVEQAAAGCGCQYDAGGRVFVDHCVCREQPTPAECPTPMHHPLTVCRICHPAGDLVQAERALAEAREALGRVEHGADDSAEQRRYAEALAARNTARQAAPAGDCVCCEASSRLCEGLVERGSARCCTECQHEQAAPAAREVSAGWAPIPEGRVRVWEQEGRSPLWQALVHRLHGADAVDNHGLSIADAERLVGAALDEIGKRETAADELAEGGHLTVETARDMLLHPGGHARSLLALASEVVVTALDVRGRERDTTRVEVERLRGGLREARAELERTPRENGRQLVRIRVANEQLREENRGLRARDEAAQEVARIWGEILRNPSLLRDMNLPPAFRAALDALGVAHEDGGQGR